MQVDAAESPGSTFEGLGEVVEGSKRHKVRGAVAPPEPGSVPGSAPPTPLIFSNTRCVSIRSMSFDGLVRLLGGSAFVAVS